MSNKILENFDWLTSVIDNNEREILKRIALEQTAPIDLINQKETERVKRIALDQITEIDPINEIERDRVKRIALDQITEIDPINEIETDRVKKIALDQITPIDPINDAEIQRVKRIALNRAADTDPINAAFNATRDQTMKKAYYIDPIQQLQNFINTQFNESLTFIDYFLLFIFIALLIYFIYNNLNSRKDYI
jgi:hypothetical protein